ncbi:MAG: PHP domain-containing protein, partial [Chloroflexi bacterium]|nr:PHP domain-containing protein [Chloroflexota bacterium]
MTHRVDLHIHTRVSDGQHSAAEIVRMALKAGLQTIAITDHDAVEAVPEAIEAVQGSGLTVLSGVEISADAGSLEIHILGYLVDWEDAELARGLAASRTSRVERAGEMLARLRGLGVLLSAERVAELADGGSIGRPHIALALREAGYVSTVQEAFDRYLGQGRPAYAPRAKMTPREAIERVLAAGGVPVLAHPFGITALVPEL